MASVMKLLGNFKIEILHLIYLHQFVEIQFALTLLVVCVSNLIFLPLSFFFSFSFLSSLSLFKLSSPYFYNCHEKLSGPILLPSNQNARG